MTTARHGRADRPDSPPPVPDTRSEGLRKKHAAVGTVVFWILFGFFALSMFGSAGVGLSGGAFVFLAVCVLMLILLTIKRSTTTLTVRPPPT